MSEQIKKSDVSEKDVFGWIIESAKIAESQIEALNTELSITAKLSKEALKKNAGATDVASLKEIERLTKTANNLIKQKETLEADLTKILAKKTDAQNQLNKAVERSNREDEKAIAKQQKLESTYHRVDGWLKKLRNEYQELAIKKQLSGKATDEEIKRMTTLEGRIKTYDGALKKVDETMGKHNRKVGDYASGFNGLGNSVNQLTREMPAFANSMQTGFMAISNNLPIFFDEITKINRANKELVAQGQPVKSVFSQLSSAIFSLGTVLSVGVTLLTIYGKEIVNMAFGVEDATEKQNRLNEAMERGNNIAEQSINQIERKRAFDKMSTKEAIDRVRAEIRMADEQRIQAKKNAQQTLRELNAVNNNQLVNLARLDLLEGTTSYSQEQRLKTRLQLQQQTKIEREEEIKKLKEFLQQLTLEQYQESKSNRPKRIKERKEETKVIEYQVKVLERLNEVNRVRFAYIEAVDEALLKRSKTEQEVYLLMAELTENERLIREARITKIKADLEIELQNIELTEAQKTKLILQAQKDIKDIEKEGQKQRWTQYKEYTDLITDYQIKKSNQRIEQIDKEISASQKQYDLLVELAKNGNIQAQQSLAEQQKMIIESEKKKKEELQKQELIKLGSTAIDVFSNKVANNDKTPLLSTIKDITLLKAFISSLASFEVGTDKTFGDGNGAGVDGKGGQLSILHKNEKVFKEEDAKKIGFDVPNSMVADVFAMYRQGALVPIGKQDYAGNSFDIAPLVKEVKELTNVMKNQEVHSLDVGRITRDLYEFAHTIQQGNKKTVNNYQIRKRG